MHVSLVLKLDEAVSTGFVSSSGIDQFNLLHKKTPSHMISLPSHMTITLKSHDTTCNLQIPNGSSHSFDWSK